MFTVSFEVADTKLATALIRLEAAIQGISSRESIRIAHAGQAHQEATEAPPRASKPRRKSKRKQKKQPLQPQPGATQRQVVRAMLEQVGTHQFTRNEFLNRLKKVGIDGSVMYSVFRDEIEAGNLVRLEPGLYQRTGAGFANTLGLSQVS